MGQARPSGGSPRKPPWLTSSPRSPRIPRNRPCSSCVLRGAFAPSPLPPRGLMWLYSGSAQAPPRSATRVRMPTQAIGVFQTSRAYFRARIVINPHLAYINLLHQYQSRPRRSLGRVHPDPQFPCPPRVPHLRPVPLPPAHRQLLLRRYSEAVLRFPALQLRLAVQPKPGRGERSARKGENGRCRHGKCPRHAWAAGFRRTLRWPY